MNSFVQDKFDFEATLLNPDREMSAAIARLKARPTTCSPDKIALFVDSTLPEVSGSLKKKTFPFL